MTQTMPKINWTQNQLALLGHFKERLVHDKIYANLSPFDERFARAHIAKANEGAVQGTRQFNTCDVPEIHEEIRQNIQRVVEQIHEQQHSRIIMLVGQPGVGKSHLVNHFRTPNIAAEQDFIFVGHHNAWKCEEFPQVLLDGILDALMPLGPTEEGLLFQKIKTIGFAALNDLLKRQSVQGIRRGGRRRFWSRMWDKITRGEHARFTRALQQNDISIFRHVDFNRFAEFICDSYLKIPGSPFHCYLMRVLLRSLFSAEDRKAVYYWLRRNYAEFDDSFFARLGIPHHKEVIEGHYKLFDVVRLLISLFTRDTTRSLSDGTTNLPDRDKVFFLTFDQVEGRDELFDAPSDWYNFFAYICELFNSLPNVLILFTMTTGLRDKIYPQLEKQFQQRIGDDERWYLDRKLSTQQICRLFEQRMHSWLRDSPQQLLAYAELESAVFPFDETQVVQFAHRLNLRELLGKFDVEFRRLLNKIAVGPLLDMEFAFQEVLRQKEIDGTKEASFVKQHLRTIIDIITLLHEPLGKASGVHFDGYKEGKTAAGLEVLTLEFSANAGPGQWVRIFLVHLPYRNWEKRYKDGLELLKGKNRMHYQLWFTRVYDPKPEVPDNCKNMVFFHELKMEEEARLQAKVKTASCQEEYAKNEWHTGLMAFLHLLKSTDIGQIFDSARMMLEKVDPSMISSDKEDLVFQPAHVGVDANTEED